MHFIRVSMDIRDPIIQINVRSAHVQIVCHQSHHFFALSSFDIELQKINNESKRLDYRNSDESSNTWKRRRVKQVSFTYTVLSH
jgi:hypothetical protein